MILEVSLLKNLSKYSVLHLGALHFKILFSSVAGLLSPIYFAALMLIIFQIAVGAHRINADIIIGITLSAVILSLIMASDQLMQRDRKDGMLELFYLSGINPYWLLAVKLFLFILMSAFIAIAVLMAASVMFSVNYEFFISIITPVLMMLPIVSVVILFISLITLGFPNKLVQYTLSLPLIVPALIFCAYAVNDKAYLMLLLGLNFIFVPLFLFFSRLVLKHSIAR